MAEYRYTASALLAELIKQLEATDVSDVPGPDVDAPKDATLVGKLSENQRALMRLKVRQHIAHDRMHDELNMPFGGNYDLPLDHRVLHIGPEILALLFAEDADQAFRGDERQFVVDRNWDIYMFPKRRRLLRRLVPWAIVLCMIVAVLHLIH